MCWSVGAALGKMGVIQLTDGQAASHSSSPSK